MDNLGDTFRNGRRQKSNRRRLLKRLIALCLPEEMFLSLLQFSPPPLLSQQMDGEMNQRQKAVSSVLPCHRLHGCLAAAKIAASRPLGISLWSCSGYVKEAAYDPRGKLKTELAVQFEQRMKSSIQTFPFMNWHVSARRRDPVNALIPSAA